MLWGDQREAGPPTPLPHTHLLCEIAFFAPLGISAPSDPDAPELSARYSGRAWARRGWVWAA